MTLCQRQENADNSPQGEHNDEKGLGVWWLIPPGVLPFWADRWGGLLDRRVLLDDCEWRGGFPVATGEIGEILGHAVLGHGLA